MATETMKPDVMTGEPMTEDEQFLLGWARESLKATIPRLDDALQKMVTLAVALAGGGVVALRDDLMPHPAFRVVAVGAFVLAALLAFCGGFLLWHGMDDEDPEDIWRVKSEAMRHKYNYYVATAVMFGTGFAVVLTGLVVRMAW